MSFTITASLMFILSFFASVSPLGINCRGSGLCPRASWNNKASASIIQILRDAVWENAKDNSTSYNDGDHIICVSQSQSITIGIGLSYDGISGTFSLSGSISEGGICLFSQGTSLTLQQIRPLTNAILEHGCTTCGSVPIHFVDEGSNDPSDGILTFNYVQNPYCDGNCISDSGSSGELSSGSVSSNAIVSMTTAVDPESISTVVITSAAIPTSSDVSVSTVVITSAAIPTSSNASAASSSAFEYFSTPSSITEASLVIISESNGISATTTSLLPGTVTVTATASSNTAGILAIRNQPVFFSLVLAFLRAI